MQFTSVAGCEYMYEICLQPEEISYNSVSKWHEARQPGEVLMALNVSLCKFMIMFCYSASSFKVLLEECL